MKEIFIIIIEGGTQDMWNYTICAFFNENDAKNFQIKKEKQLKKLHMKCNEILQIWYETRISTRRVSLAQHILDIKGYSIEKIKIL